jgi:prepilin-type N-terminal cleavage/methylation domain-containing protein
LTPVSRSDPLFRAAFSLIELMLVVAILAVVSAMALPRYANSLHAYRATVAAKRIASDLQLAQFRARSLSTTRTVAFTVSSSSYQLIGETDLANSTATYTVQVGDLPYRAQITSVQFGTIAGTASVTFNGFGMPNNGGSITLTSGNATRTIILAPLTGGVSIQ